MSSNHTWVSRDVWSEMNRQIGSLNAYLINSNLQADLIRRQYEDRIQQIEDSYRANAQVVTQAVNAFAYGVWSTNQEAVVDVAALDTPKCVRCWKFDSRVGENADHPELCPRCAAVVGKA